MESNSFGSVSFKDFRWLNEPKVWQLVDSKLVINTENKSDFWQKTWYNFQFNTGHVYGVDLKDDFTFDICIEANFTTLYDQAGLMIYLDEKHWLKSGIEYNDGQPMIGSVMTNGVSDWATGLYTGDPRKFWLRLTKARDVVCVKYSTDNVTWNLLRLCQFPKADKYFVGPMCCTPMREGLQTQVDRHFLIRGICTSRILGVSSTIISITMQSVNKQLVIVDDSTEACGTPALMPMLSEQYSYASAVHKASDPFAQAHRQHV